jgi:hypothetical protein
MNRMKQVLGKMNLAPVQHLQYLAT